MSVQKSPDEKGKLDNSRIRWEQDLKPFTRLPREKRPHTRQRLPAWIPLLVSLTAIVPVCALSVSLLNRLRPAARALALPTATTIYVLPSASPTVFIPPTATPYVAPTDTPIPQPTQAANPAADGTVIAVGGKVRITNTGGAGVNFRDQPSISGKLLRKLPENNVYEVIGGPQEADGYTWWQLRDASDGALGWGAQNFLVPAP